MAQMAQDTFTAELKDGSVLRVARGEVYADNHEVVKLDGGRGLLFRPLDMGDADAPAKPAPKASRAAAKGGS
jgi:hypothetical protein